MFHSKIVYWTSPWKFQRLLCWNTASSKLWFWHWCCQLRLSIGLNECWQIPSEVRSPIFLWLSRKALDRRKMKLSGVTFFPSSPSFVPHFWKDKGQVPWPVFMNLHDLSYTGLSAPMLSHSYTSAILMDFSCPYNTRCKLLKGFPSFAHAVPTMEWPPSLLLDDKL